MDSCGTGYCGKCRGMMKGLLGVLILINLFVWPRWTGIDGWMGFIGLLLILGGIAKSVMPACNCCTTEPHVHHEHEAAAPAKKGKK